MSGDRITGPIRLHMGSICMIPTVLLLDMSALPLEHRHKNVEIAGFLDVAEGWSFIVSLSSHYPLL